MLPEHLSWARVLVGFVLPRFVVVCVCFVDRCLFFCSFSFCHYIVRASSILGLWLFLWYLQTLRPHYLFFQYSYVIPLDISIHLPFTKHIHVCPIFVLLSICLTTIDDIRLDLHRCRYSIHSVCLSSIFEFFITHLASLNFL